MNLVPPVVHVVDYHPRRLDSTSADKAMFIHNHPQEETEGRGDRSKLGEAAADVVDGGITPSHCRDAGNDNTTGTDDMEVKSYPDEKRTDWSSLEDDSPSDHNDEAYMTSDDDQSDDSDASQTARSDITDDGDDDDKDIDDGDDDDDDDSDIDEDNEADDSDDDKDDDKDDDSDEDDNNEDDEDIMRDYANLFDDWDDSEDAVVAVNTGGKEKLRKMGVEFYLTLNELQIAVGVNDLERVNAILAQEDYDMNMSQQTPPSQRPLARALINGNKDIVQVLVKHGVVVQPQHSVAYVVGIFGCVKSIELLEEAGLNVNSQDHQRRRLLHGAVRHNTIQFVQQLLLRGAEPNCLDNDGLSPLHYAAQTGADIAMFDLLVNHGADMNIGGGLTNGTPLHIACKEGVFSSINKLSELGADPNLLDKRGFSPLQVVVEDHSGSLFVHNNDPLNSLIQAGADINHPGDKTSPLHMALRTKKYRTAELLLIANARVTHSMFTDILQLKQPQLYKALRDASENVTTLRHRCRAVINQNIQYSWPRKGAVDLLPLPTYIKGYLLNAELSSCVLSIAEEQHVNLFYGNQQ